MSVSLLTTYKPPTYLIVFPTIPSASSSSRCPPSSSSSSSPLLSSSASTFTLPWALHRHSPMLPSPPSSLSSSWLSSSSLTMIHSRAPFLPAFLPAVVLPSGFAAIFPFPLPPLHFWALVAASFFDLFFFGVLVDSLSSSSDVDWWTSFCFLSHLTNYGSPEMSVNLYICLLCLLAVTYVSKSE